MNREAQRRRLQTESAFAARTSSTWSPASRFVSVMRRCCTEIDPVVGQARHAIREPVVRRRAEIEHAEIERDDAAAIVERDRVAQPERRRAVARTPSTSTFVSARRGGSRVLGQSLRDRRC